MRPRREEHNSPPLGHREDMELSPEDKQRIIEEEKQRFAEEEYRAEVRERLARQPGPRGRNRVLLSVIALALILGIGLFFTFAIRRAAAPPRWSAASAEASATTETPKPLAADSKPEPVASPSAPISKSAPQEGSRTKAVPGPVRRAAIELQQATDGGVTRSEFNRLLAKLKSEIEVAKDAGALPGPLKPYSSAVLAYELCGISWDLGNDDLLGRCLKEASGEVDKARAGT